MPEPAIYSSAKVLFWMTALGLYGTAEGVGRLVKGAPVVWRKLRHRMRSHAHDTEFYFSYRESGYIIMPGGDMYLNSRREKIVALRRLEEVPLSYDWSGQGVVKEELFPSEFSLVDAPRLTGQRRVRKRVKFSTPIEKGGSAEYVLLLRCSKMGTPPGPYLGSRCSHRVDELLLRVVFPEDMRPDKVFYIQRNADGVELSKETITEFDHLTGEFQKFIKDAEPHVDYMIEWQM